MVTEYKKFISFKSIFYFCSLPLRLDSYRGCTIGCHYCFSKSINNRKEKFNKVIPANPNKFGRYFLQSPNEKRIGIVKQCVDRRIPFHFGCVSDPFQPAEKKYKITYEMLKIIFANSLAYLWCNILVGFPYLAHIFKEDLINERTPSLRAKRGNLVKLAADLMRLPRRYAPRKDGVICPRHFVPLNDGVLSINGTVL